MSFDRESFMSLIEGDKELFLSLLTLFEDDWPKLMKQMRSALASKDSKTVEHTAHRIKGNLRNFYAEESAKIAQGLEDAGKNGELEGLESAIEELATCLNQVQMDLRSFLNEMN